MCNAARFTQHSRLLSRMADAVGVDVEARTQSGDLLPEVFDTMIFDCLGCTRPASCGAWLDAPREAHAKTAPGYCRNRDALAAMGGTP